jgi:hypothetical protein
VTSKEKDLKRKEKQLARPPTSKKAKT